MAAANRKIVQVIPAEGWEVVYRGDDGQEFADDVAFFGLVEETGTDGLIEGETVSYLVPMMVDGAAIMEEDSNNMVGLRRKPEPRRFLKPLV